MSDTIFAPATARGKAGVAILRISGPNALTAAAQLGVTGLQPRKASLRALSDGSDKIDDALVLYFPHGQSFTGEEVVELQVHGSQAVLARLMDRLGSMPGLRLAEPGEFTRRALANGVMDLTQVEGLADLLDAETEAQRRQAQRVLSGDMGRKVEGWRSLIIRAGALIEATIDFADEDVPEDVVPEVLGLIRGLREALIAELEGGRVAERIRDGFEVAIIGAPNAGKSSLLNLLAGRDAAITSSVAGTTRDVIEVRMDLRGLPVILLDTAGLRESSDDIEKIGIERALQRAATADLRVLLVDPEQPVPSVELAEDDIQVYGKADRHPEIGGISSLTGSGVPELVDQIAEVLEGRASGAGILVRARHQLAVKGAVEALDSAFERLYEGGESLELVANDLRQARRALETLMGRVDIESLLDEIFSSFCIGK